jgi:hypothetical protein
VLLKLGTSDEQLNNRNTIASTIYKIKRLARIHTHPLDLEQLTAGISNDKRTSASMSGNGMLGFVSKALHSLEANQEKGCKATNTSEISGIKPISITNWLIVKPLNLWSYARSE